MRMLNVLDQLVHLPVIRVHIRSLMCTGQKSGLPVLDPLNRQAPRTHRHKAGKIFVLTPQTIGDPGTNTGSGLHGVAAVHQHERRLMVRHLSIHRTNDCDVINVSSGFLEEVIIYATSHESGAKGCFLASSVSASIGEVEGVKERVEKAIDDTDRRLAARFDLEKEKNVLSPDFPSLERARLLYDIRQGYMFRGRAGWTAEAMREDLDDRANMILADAAE